VLALLRCFFAEFLPDLGELLWEGFTHQ